VVKYLEKGLTIEELKGIVAKTHKNPFELIRTQEKIFKENFRGRSFSDEEWLKIISENPKLLQRPVVINGDKAVLAQPPEEVDKII